MDQGSAHALSAGGFGGKQILQIAGGLDSRGAAVKQVVCQAEQLFAAFRDKTMDRFMGVEEARPRHCCRLGSKRGGTGPSVKRIVSVPQREPLVVVLPGYQADRHLAGNLGFCIHGGAIRRARASGDDLAPLLGTRVSTRRDQFTWQSISGYLSAAGNTK